MFARIYSMLSSLHDNFAIWEIEKRRFVFVNGTDQGVPGCICHQSRPLKSTHTLLARHSRQLRLQQLLPQQLCTCPHRRLIRT
jgi:hypothetical protein